MGKTILITSKCETQSGKKKQFGQSKCRILHALHKLRKKRAGNASVVQGDSTVKFHIITSSISLVTSYDSCLACQHSIQIGLSTNWVRN